jgi:hypothetical protein
VAAMVELLALVFRFDELRFGFGTIGGVCGASSDEFASGTSLWRFRVVP